MAAPAFLLSILRAHGSERRADVGIGPPSPRNFQPPAASFHWSQRLWITRAMAW